MLDLAYRQQKIQEKRKQTSFRDFVMEIASRMPFNLTKNNDFIARYPRVRMQNIIAHKEFEQIRNDETSFNLSEPTFFSNLQKLFTSLSLNPTLQLGNNENSEFADSVLNSKNCYLSFGIFEWCSNILYSVLVTNNCYEVFNSMQVTNFSEHIYYSKSVDKSSFIYYSKFIINSSNIRFSSNLVGCHDCIKCDNLQNQSYCVSNKQYSKDEYQKFYATMLKKKEIYHQEFAKVFDTSLNLGSENVQGNGILFSSNIENGYYVTRATKGRNLIFVTWENTDSNLYDCCDTGINAVDFYGVQWGGTNANSYYCVSQCESCANVFYSYYLYNCSFCLGCVGLKNKSFCILNKQYTKEERHTKVDEIFTQMEKDWTLWQFFPATMNPFYFNDTAAYLIDPSFTKEEVEKAGYLRRDEPIKVDIPADLEQVHVRDLDQYEGYDESGKWHINEEILKKVIIDEQGNVRRIVNMEYVFLMKHGLPLPRKHWLERMKENFKVG